MTTTTDKVARRKLSLLELASDLDNVSKACKVMGYSRQQFYEIRRNFQTFGAQGMARQSGWEPRVNQDEKRRSGGMMIVARVRLGKC